MIKVSNFFKKLSISCGKNNFFEFSLFCLNVMLLHNQLLFCFAWNFLAWQMLGNYVVSLLNFFSSSFIFLSVFLLMPYKYTTCSLYFFRINFFSMITILFHDSFLVSTSYSCSIFNMNLRHDFIRKVDEIYLRNVVRSKNKKAMFLTSTCNVIYSARWNIVSDRKDCSFLGREGLTGLISFCSYSIRVLLARSEEKIN